MTRPDEGARIAEEICQKHTPVYTHWGDLPELIAAALRAQREAGWREGRDAALSVVLDEPEYPGPLPPELLQRVRRAPADALRSTVRLTKGNIAAAIRALLPPDPPGAGA